MPLIVDFLAQLPENHLSPYQIEKSLIRLKKLDWWLASLYLKKER